ncbi:MAG: hypothetical protein LBK69_03485 [Syntrophomonadaceae bacterium]|nr:hypothetical protein [Syntrophomonadaceae bacterium]
MRCALAIFAALTAFAIALTAVTMPNMITAIAAPSNAPYIEPSSTFPNTPARYRR